MNLNNRFGLRFGCLILIWFSLGGALMGEDVSQRAFVSALILYLLPLSLDYYGHTPKSDENRTRQQIGIWSTFILSMVLMGINFFAGIDISNLLNWELQLMSVKITFKFIIWIVMLAFLVLAGIDWVAYSTPEEMRFRDQIQQIIRERVESNTMENRVKHYKEQQKEKKKEKKEKKEKSDNVNFEKDKTGTDEN